MGWLINWWILASLSHLVLVLWPWQYAQPEHAAAWRCLGINTPGAAYSQWCIEAGGYIPASLPLHGAINRWFSIVPQGVPGGIKPLLHTESQAHDYTSIGFLLSPVSIPHSFLLLPRTTPKWIIYLRVSFWGKPNEARSWIIRTSWLGDWKEMTSVTIINNQFLK